MTDLIPSGPLVERDGTVGRNVRPDAPATQTAQLAALVDCKPPINDCNSVAALRGAEVGAARPARDGCRGAAARRGGAGCARRNGRAVRGVEKPRRTLPWGRGESEAAARAGVVSWEEGTLTPLL